MLTYPDEINGVRSDWSEQRAGMMKDLDTVLRYKSWSLVATHNPEGEYGHMQHKLTDRITTQAYYRALSVCIQLFSTRFPSCSKKYKFPSIRTTPVRIV